VTTSASAGAAAAPGFFPDNPTLIERMAGILVRPGRTFDRVIADPQWRGVLVASTLLAVLAGASVMSTAVGRQGLVDEWERTAAALGHEVGDAGYGQLERLSRYGPLYAAAGALASGPLLAIGVAGLLSVAFGRRHPVRPAFTTVFAIAVHAGVVLSLRHVVAAGLLYGRETTANALSVGAWFPGLDATSPAARALGIVDLFVLWWVVVLAIGTARLYHRRVRATALGFVGVYVALALLTAAAFTAAGGTA
jgi:hypothetical protein